MDILLHPAVRTTLQFQSGNLNNISSGFVCVIAGRYDFCSRIFHYIAFREKRTKGAGVTGAGGSGVVVVLWWYGGGVVKVMW